MQQAWHIVGVQKTLVFILLLSSPLLIIEMIKVSQSCPYFL